VDHVHGVWLFACGHEAFRCKCIQRCVAPQYRTDLCRECRESLKHSSPPEPFPPAKDRAEPFPKATD
jgi:hypothetical protein